MKRFILVLVIALMLVSSVALAFSVTVSCPASVAPSSTVDCDLALVLVDGEVGPQTFQFKFGVPAGFSLSSPAVTSASMSYNSLSSPAVVYSANPLLAGKFATVHFVAGTTSGIISLTEKLSESGATFSSTNAIVTVAQSCTPVCASPSTICSKTPGPSDGCGGICPGTKVCLPQPGSCSLVNLAACTSASACTTASGVWDTSVNPAQCRSVCLATLLGSCTELTCTAASFAWNENPTLGNVGCYTTCPPGSTKDLQGNCVAQQTACPSDAAGTYPGCTCTTLGEEYEQASNTCVATAENPLKVVADNPQQKTLFEKIQEALNKQENDSILKKVSSIAGVFQCYFKTECDLATYQIK